MTTDKNGQELKEGDLVIVPCRVTRIQPEGDITYLSLVTVETFPFGGPNVLVLTPAQVIKGMQLDSAAEVERKLAKFREETAHYLEKPPDPGGSVPRPH